jgi:hypothetical protein
MTPATKASNLKDSTGHPSSDPANPFKDFDHDAADTDENHEGDKPVHEDSHERTITLKRWIALPQSVADGKPEPKYLADRRPGLPPLYGHRAATNTFTTGTTGYAPNISSTLPKPNTNTGDVVVGSVTVPSDHAANVSGYQVSADGTTMPIGPGMAMSGAQAQGEAPRRRPPPPPPKRKKKGGPGRSKKKVGVVEPMAGGSGETGAAAGAVGGQAGPAETTAGGVEGAIPQPAATEKGETGSQQVDGESKAADQDTEMGEAEDEGSSSEEEGSEEGEIDEGGHAGSTAVEVPREQPDVSVQPPSPDLLGNLESEIQGMEKGAPTA